MYNNDVRKIMLQLMPDCADELSTFVYDFMLEASYISEAFLSAEAMAKSFTSVRNDYATEYYVEFSLFPSTKLRMSNKLRKALLKMLRDLALMQFQRMRKLPQAFVYQMCQMPAPIVAPPEPAVVAEPAPVFDLDSDDGFADFSPFGADLWNETFDSDATLFEML